jgi:hypothetical protein
MSIPDDKQNFAFEFSFNNLMWIAIALAVVVMVYGIIFHALPYEEAKGIQYEEIKNKMSCGDLQQMILDRTAISPLNHAEVKHQFEWRCEK